MLYFPLVIFCHLTSEQLIKPLQSFVPPYQIDNQEGHQQKYNLLEKTPSNFSPLCKAIPQNTGHRKLYLLLWCRKTTELHCKKLLYAQK